MGARKLWKWRSSSANTLPFAGPLSPRPVGAGLAFGMLLWSVVKTAAEGLLEKKTVDGVRTRWIGMQGWIWTGFKHPKLGAAALAPEPTAEGKKQKSFALLGLSWGSLRQQGSESCMQSLQAELLSMGDKTCRLALFDNSINVVRDRQVGV